MATILLSGGLDSSVLLHHVAATCDEPLHALSFNYGQRHVRELACAAYQADIVRASHQVIDISFMGELLKGGSALVAAGAAVPDLTDLTDDELQQPPTYVPNRNMMLLSMAAACAEARRDNAVYYGAQAQDEYGYWDCTEEFLGRINAVLQLNRKTAVTIFAPFVAWSKADIVRRGMELGVDFDKTWSCYRGGDTPCGTCPTCVERINAFREAGVGE